MDVPGMEFFFSKSPFIAYSKKIAAGKRQPLLFSCRMFLAVIMFFGLLNIYLQRVGMSVAIVCMINHTAVASSNSLQFDNRTVDPNCIKSINRTEYIMEDGKLEYDKVQQGHILGAFFYGYLISQIPGGILAERFGGKKIFGIFTAISTAATLLTPSGAKMGLGILLFLRVLVGLGSGAAFPILHSIWSQWAPPLERSKLVSLSYAGAMMGSVAGMPLSGALCEFGFAGGWPSIFYITGLSTAFWLVFWLIFVSDNPSSHSMINEKEKLYIINSLQGQLLKNPKNNGYFSALPWIGLWANMSISPLIADKLISSHYLSITKTRKLMTAIGGIGASACLVGLAFTDCRAYPITIGLLTLGVTLSGSQYSGFLVNHIDIAPKYAGTLFGISNMLGSVAGFVAPPLVGYLTKNQRKDQWMVVLFISSGVLVFGSVFFIIFGSGRLQNWTTDDEQENEDGAELKSML
ncbi:DgyrCDS2029 [Dimorphilus gyrociliatus]|uniref:Sialin n=1 Tax=Dimorphilus gyrociliatus TaxID=2664684 RepID=A0A7I8V996_9ANNE|nr:DgyrCDS2029 [Dimorphilus gyrociliatus]